MPIKAVLFDLGGVLIKLSGSPPIAAIPEDKDEDAIWDRWLLSTSVRRFESGQCNANEFAANIIEEFSLDQTPEEFVANFKAWPGKLFDGATELLKQLREHCVIASLSNTNPVHWANFERDHQLAELFHHNLPSHQTGLLKPDVEAFQHAAQTLGLPPAAILFLDDNKLNILAAEQYGLNARLTRGCSEARAHLETFGLR